MRNRLVFDERLGQFEGRFSVRLEGEDVVFEFEPPVIEGEPAPWVPDLLVRRDERRMENGGPTRRALDMDCGLFERLARLVMNTRAHRLPSEVVPDRMFVLSKPFAYALEGSSMLLSLARDIGPLFGLYNRVGVEREGLTVREPLSAWVEAAGVALLATRLDSFSTGTDGADLEPDIAYFFQRISCRGFEVDSWEATYLMDNGADMPYRSLLLRPRGASAPKTPPLYERDDILGDLVFSGNVRLLGEELISERGHGMAYLDLRDDGDVSRLRSFLVGPPSAPLEAGAIASFSQEKMMSSPQTALVAREICRSFLNQLLEVHQGGKGTIARKGETTVTSYACALERLWSSFGVRSEYNHFSICRYCGKPFLPKRGDQAYCPPRPDEPWNRGCKAMREEWRRRKRKERTKRIYGLVRGLDLPTDKSDWSSPGRYVTPQDICYLYRLKYGSCATFEEVGNILMAMSRDASVPVRLSEMVDGVPTFYVG